MPADLSGSLLSTGEGSSTSKQNTLIQAIQDALNNIGDTSKMAFAAGAIFTLSQIKQSGATSGQVPMWSGTQWAPDDAPGSAFALIQDSNLGGDATVSFTSIPSTYKHLKIVAYVRTDRAATEDSLGVRFNNDSAGNYDGYSFKMSGTGPTTAGSETIAGTAATFTNALTGTSAGANLFGYVEINIPYYANTANNKQIELFAAKKIGTSTGNFHIISGSGSWRANSAISRIDLLPTVGTNFKSGSRFSLYGL